MKKNLTNSETRFFLKKYVKNHDFDSFRAKNGQNIHFSAKILSGETFRTLQCVSYIIWKMNIHFWRWETTEKWDNTDFLKNTLSRIRDIDMFLYDVFWSQKRRDMEKLLSDELNIYVSRIDLRCWNLIWHFRGHEMTLWKLLNFESI